MYDWSQTTAGKQQAALRVVSDRGSDLGLARRRLIQTMKRARDVGCSHRSIAESAGVSYETVRKWLKELEARS